MFVGLIVGVRINCLVRGGIISFKVYLITLIWPNLKKGNYIEQTANYLKSNIGKNSSQYLNN